MKRRELMMAGLGLVGAAATALAVGEDQAAGEKAVKLVDSDVNPETVAGIKAVLMEHDRAFTSNDLDGVLSTYHKGPHTVLMGTGPGEMWAGLEEIGEAYKHFFADFDKGTQDFKYHYLNAATLGDVAWMTVMGDVSAAKGEKKIAFAMNASVVFAKDAGKWQVRQFHFSNLTGPEKPAEKELPAAKEAK